MNKYFFLLSIFIFSSLNAGWANFVNSIKHGFKSVFSYQYVMKQKHSEVFKNYVNELQPESRKVSNAIIVDEIKKSGISDFFKQSKSAIPFVGIFNTTEAAFLIHEIKSKIADDKQKQAELENSESTEDLRIAKSEKRPSIRDIRELKELCKYEHNPNMSKNAISFSVSSTMNNLAKIQISLVERVLATKRMQNRETGLIEDVPVTKKQVKIMVIGTENENGTFSWEKITNDTSSEDATPTEKKKLTFNDNANATALEYPKIKLSKFMAGHPGLKVKSK